MPTEAGREWARGIRRVAQPRERTGAGAMRGATAGETTGTVVGGANIGIVGFSQVGSCTAGPDAIGKVGQSHVGYGDYAG